MIKNLIIVLSVTVFAQSNLIADDGSRGIGKRDCHQLHRAVRNQLETIYLVQTAEFWATRTGKIEQNPELSDGISVALQEVGEALGHYDSGETRRAIDVILKFCPL